MRVLIAQPNLDGASETFLRAHAERLPFEVTVAAAHPLRDDELPRTAAGPVLSEDLAGRVGRKLERTARRKPWAYRTTQAYRKAIADAGADLVLAEYGIVGAVVAEACGEAGVPLVVHFHGHDATRRSVLEQFGDRYPPMFARAAAVVGVSRAMHAQLLKLGSEPGKTFLNHYGIDCGQFGGADPAAAGPALLAVGRFVPKKAPHLTLLAFAEAAGSRPAARLRMIGEGELLPICRDLAAGLGVADRVDFPGPLPHDAVAAAMRSARAFVQHSVEAADGDCEGTPNTVLEAGAAGLPVVATRHAGIPDVVLDGETGLLCGERDVAGMAAAMGTVLDDAGLAGEMGRSARRRVRESFAVESSIDRLAAVLRFAAGAGPKPPLFPPGFGPDETTPAGVPAAPARPRPAATGAAE